MVKLQLCLGTNLAWRSCPNLFVAENSSLNAVVSYLDGILYEIPFHKDMQHVKHGETNYCVQVHILVPLLELLLRSLPLSFGVLKSETCCHA